MVQKSDRKGLGRGLSALLADAEPESARPDDTVPIDLIEANPDQPRRNFDPLALDDLTKSVAEKGILQPLVVRAAPGKQGRYQIVAGERRWRAAQKAGLHDIPVVIRTLSDAEVLELAIIENVQRADLNPLEEAEGYRQLIERFGHTQDQIATALGKSRSHIANLLRLLALPSDIQALLSSGAISAGHARALLPIDDPMALARRIVDEGLSVRQTEALAKVKKDPAAPARLKAKKDADTRALEADLSAQLGLKVRIDHGPSGERGELRVNYQTLDELDTLCQRLIR
ncbi:MAG: ParB/RepB/Spo0J family partition protein [Pseudomonadota bacterium]